MLDVIQISGLYYCTCFNAVSVLATAHRQELVFET